MKKMIQHPALKYISENPNDYPGLDIKECIVNTHFEVCPDCDGHGTHFRNDLDENLLVQGLCEDGDEDGLNAYHRGAFDEVCDTCHGQRVVDGYNENDVPKWAIKEMQEWDEEEADFAIVQEAERRAGA